MPRAWMSGFIVLVLSLVSCSGADPEPSPIPEGPGGTLGRSAVEVPEGWQGAVTITAAPVTDSLVTDTQALLDTGILVGMPLEISVDTPMPPQGLTISRTYPAPLPQDMAATLAYFNAEAGGWQAVPSQISADRRTVSATVDHLSIWSDFVLGSQQALTEFRAAAGDVIRAGSEFTSSAVSAAGQRLGESADWMYYAVGKVFDTRVDAPVCETSAPEWVSSVISIEDNRNNPIRFCFGHDTRHPELLVVKARVNRGFAFSAVPGVGTEWRHNSSDPAGLWEAVLPWLRSNDEALRDVLFEVTGGDPQLLVGAGQELGLGLDEKDVRAGSTSTVLTLEPPSAATFVYSVIGRLIMQDLALKDTSLVTTALAMSSCFSSIAEADRHDPLKVAAAVLVCLQSQSETITKLAVRIMTETGFDPKTTVSTSRALTRASIYLALVGPVFSAMNWYAETQTLKSARTVDVFTTAGGQLEGATTSAALPRYPATNDSGNDLESFLHEHGITIIEPPIDFGCTLVGVSGADLSKGDVDLTVIESRCDGDVVVSWYTIRDGRVQSTGWASPEAEVGDLEGLEAFDKPYGGLEGSFFDVSPGEDRFYLTPMP